MWYSPWALVAVVRTRPVSRLRRDTWAPTTTCPALFLTRPRTAPAVEEVWAEATTAQARAVRVRVVNLRFMSRSWARGAAVGLQGSMRRMPPRGPRRDGVAQDHPIPPGDSSDNF